MSRWRFSSDIAVYLAEAQSLLNHSEAENNLLLGVLRSLVDHPELIPEDLLLLQGEGGMFAIQTPPRALILSTGWTAEALSELADTLRERGFDLPGVTGPLELSKHFAHRWSPAPKLLMDQGLYRLDALESRPAVRGDMAVASADDAKLIARWALEFHREAMSHEAITADEFLRWSERRFEDGVYRLWLVHGEPHAWAGISGQTNNGSRVGPVYTPPQFRKQGYGSALTWELSNEVLKSGRKFCFLYTDLTNPVSNSIYQKIGYRQILRSQHWGF